MSFQLRLPSWSVLVVLAISSAALTAEPQTWAADASSDGVSKCPLYLTEGFVSREAQIFRNSDGTLGFSPSNISERAKKYFEQKLGDHIKSGGVIEAMWREPADPAVPFILEQMSGSIDQGPRLMGAVPKVPADGFRMRPGRFELGSEFTVQTEVKDGEVVHSKVIHKVTSIRIYKTVGGTLQFYPKNLSESDKKYLTDRVTSGDLSLPADVVLTTYNPNGLEDTELGSMRMEEQYPLAVIPGSGVIDRNFEMYNEMSTDALLKMNRGQITLSQEDLSRLVQNRLRELKADHQYVRNIVALLPSPKVRVSINRKVFTFEPALSSEVPARVFDAKGREVKSSDRLYSQVKRLAHSLIQEVNDPHTEVRVTEALVKIGKSEVLPKGKEKSYLYNDFRYVLYGNNQIIRDIKENVILSELDDDYVQIGRYEEAMKVYQSLDNAITSTLSSWQPFSIISVKIPMRQFAQVRGDKTILQFVAIDFVEGKVLESSEQAAKIMFEMLEGPVLADLIPLDLNPGHRFYAPNYTGKYLVYDAEKKKLILKSDWLSRLIPPKRDGAQR